MLEQLDTPGGHIAVCMVLIAGGMTAAQLGLSHGSELVVFSLGVLSRSMYGQATNRQQPQPPPANPPQP